MIKFFNYFPTIQGEGSTIGKSVFLFRLWGCNFTCKWCDISDVSQGKVPYKTIKDKNDETYIQLINDIIAYKDKYKIDTILITGGEPTLYFTGANKEIFNTIVSFFDYLEIETNGVLTHSNFSYLYPFKYFRTIDNIKFNCSPKMNIDAYRRYPYIRDINDIIDLYRHTIENLIRYSKITSKDNVNIKLVYKPEYSENILKFIKELNIPNELIYILPYTPVEYFSNPEKFFEEFKSSRLKTVDFCLKYGFRYTPREHIELYFTKENEHLDI